MHSVTPLPRQVSKQLRAGRRMGLDQECRKTTDVQLLPALEQCAQRAQRSLSGHYHRLRFSSVKMVHDTQD